MACLIHPNLDDAVMTYDAFMYVLMRTAADDDEGTFRTAFENDPGGTLAKANHAFNYDLQDPEMTLPSREDAQAMLRDYLHDYDGSRMSVRKIPRIIGNKFYGSDSEQS